MFQFLADLKSISHWPQAAGLFVLSFALGFTLSLPTTGRAAHNWTGRHHHTPPIRVFDGPNTSDCFKDEVYFASSHPTYSWTAHTTAVLQYMGTALQNHADNVIFWSSFDGPGGALGETHGFSESNGSDGHTVVNAGPHTHMDTAESWFICGFDAAWNGVTPPSNQWDLWSIITHEVGHFIVLGDLSPADAACPDSVGAATMCTGPDYFGHPWLRQPDTAEDRNSTSNAYPPPPVPDPDPDPGPIDIG